MTILSNSNVVIGLIFMFTGLIFIILKFLLRPVPQDKEMEEIYKRKHLNIPDRTSYISLLNSNLCLSCLTLFECRSDRQNVQNDICPSCGRHRDDSKMIKYDEYENKKLIGDDLIIPLTDMISFQSTCIIRGGK